MYLIHLFINKENENQDEEKRTVQGRNPVPDYNAMVS
jgi:hypothetical protein